jgi:hypothetical protein
LGVTTGIHSQIFQTLSEHWALSTGEIMTSMTHITSKSYLVLGRQYHFQLLHFSHHAFLLPACHHIRLLNTSVCSHGSPTCLILHLNTYFTLYSPTIEALNAIDSLSTKLKSNVYNQAWVRCWRSTGNSAASWCL